ncbi:adenylate isopentenyltransferase 5, chloroplastic-like [Andrographis paniculata]|uniref:adenylate isopentenyltransferase 5, chloroplastic-like n=1 Tax=Andrographis paniculata TaxID=175694 RepID=UPI0021E8F0B6|nr:adenylate isopentenyltransferase 5, chloroplastic-like [Andrographis paniculata]
MPMWHLRGGLTDTCWPDQRHMANACTKDFNGSSKAGLKNKVVVILGATGTGKTRISVELANHFNGEIINSDKIQVYKGLDIVSNKVTPEEAGDVPHHLLGFVDPDEDFTAEDFVRYAMREVEAIIERGNLPIITGGSNSFLRALLLNDHSFSVKYEFCLIWIDVSAAFLHRRLLTRVDQMVREGLVDEVKEFFNPNGDYSRGVRRAIGVPEMDEFYRQEMRLDEESKVELLEASINRIKENTYVLALRQLENIFDLWKDLGSPMMHRFDVTKVLIENSTKVERAWDTYVLGPSVDVVTGFLSEKNMVEIDG